DVVQRIRRGNRAVVAGIVDDRWEEVEGEDEGALRVEAVDGRVVSRRKADEQIFGLGGDESPQQLLEPRGRILRRAAAAGGEICEFDGLRIHWNADSR